MSTIKDEHKTLKDVTYFPPGTRRHQFMHEIENVGLPLMLTRTILAPLERWRIIKQTNKSMISQHTQYRSLFDFITTAPQKQPFWSYWKGNLANCQIYIVQLVSQYWFYENINTFWTWPTTSEIQRKLATVSKLFIACAATNILTFPYETARIRLIMDFYKKKTYQNYKGVWDALSLARKREGFFKGTYKGYTISVFTSTLYFAIYGFAAGLFDEVKPEIQSQSPEQNITQNAWFDEVKQLAAILCTSTVIYPLDTIKHRLQLNNHGIGMLHKNGRHIIQQILNSQGALSLFNGMSTYLVKTTLGFYLFKELLRLKKQGNINYF